MFKKGVEIGQFHSEFVFNCLLPDEYPYYFMLNKYRPLEFLQEKSQHGFNSFCVYCRFGRCLLFREADTKTRPKKSLESGLLCGISLEFLC